MRRCRARSCASRTIAARWSCTTPARRRRRPRPLTAGPTASGPVNPALRAAIILPPPVLANGTVYAIWWVFQPSTAICNPGSASWTRRLERAAELFCGPTTNRTGSYYYDDDPRLSGLGQLVATSPPPLLATVPGSTGQTHQMLFVNGGTRVWGVDIDANTATAYVLPGSMFADPTRPAAARSSAVSAFANGVLWFGDDGSNLHAVDGQNMTPLPNTPSAPGRRGPASPPPRCCTRTPRAKPRCSSALPAPPQPACWYSTRQAAIRHGSHAGDELDFAVDDGHQRRRVRGWRTGELRDRKRTFGAGVWHPCRPGGAGAARLHRRLAADAGLRRSVRRPPTTPTAWRATRRI